MWEQEDELEEVSAPNQVAYGWHEHLLHFLLKLKEKANDTTCYHLKVCNIYTGTVDTYSNSNAIPAPGSSQTLMPGAAENLRLFLCLRVDPVTKSIFLVGERARSLCVLKLEFATNSPGLEVQRVLEITPEDIESRVGQRKVFFEGGDDRLPCNWVTPDAIAIEMILLDLDHNQITQNHMIFIPNSEMKNWKIRKVRGCKLYAPAALSERMALIYSSSEYELYKSYSQVVSTAGQIPTVSQTIKLDTREESLGWKDISDMFQVRTQGRDIENAAQFVDNCNTWFEILFGNYVPHSTSVHIQRHKGRLIMQPLEQLSWERLYQLMPVADVRLEKALIQSGVQSLAAAFLCRTTKSIYQESQTLPRAKSSHYMLNKCFSEELNQKKSEYLTTRTESSLFECLQ